MPSVSLTLVTSLNSLKNANANIIRQSVARISIYLSLTPGHHH